MYTVYFKEFRDTLLSPSIGKHNEQYMLFFFTVLVYRLVGDITYTRIKHTVLHSVYTLAELCSVGMPLHRTVTRPIRVLQKKIKRANKGQNL